MADAQLVTVQVQVPQELSDIKDLVVGVARDLKAGKKAMEVVFGALPKLEAAMSNLSKIPDEIKSPGVYTVGAILIADMLQIFLPSAAKANASDVAGNLAEAADAAVAELQKPDASTDAEAAPLV